MLKIKDEVDLKELEKFGYEFGNHGLLGTGWYKDLNYGDFIIIYENGNIVFEFDDVMDYEACELKAVNDLIQAGLVKEE